jgi:hypothetical protein
MAVGFTSLPGNTAPCIEAATTQPTRQSRQWWSLLSERIFSDFPGRMEPGAESLPPPDSERSLRPGGNIASARPAVEKPEDTRYTKEGRTARRGRMIRLRQRTQDALESSEPVSRHGTD